MNPIEMMHLAIDVARKGIDEGQTPFGAAVFRGEDVVCVAHNTVWRESDPTAHAEVNAIRGAARQLQTIDLSGCVMYSTCEPCAMCLSAIHWSKIDRVAYGASIADAAEAGFSELTVGAVELARMAGSPLKVEKGPLHQECLQLFRMWKEVGKSGIY